jgi:hypothetical protein
VFRTLSQAAGSHLLRLPDGETGIRKTWIRFLQDVLAADPAIELATDVPPFKFVQWDGKVVREIPRLRVKPGAMPQAKSFKTGYADMAIESWRVFERLQQPVQSRLSSSSRSASDADRAHLQKWCRPTGRASCRR